MTVTHFPTIQAKLYTRFIILDIVCFSSKIRLESQHAYEKTPLFFERSLVLSTNSLPTFLIPRPSNKINNNIKYMEMNMKLFERLNGAIFLLVPWYLHINNHEIFGKPPYTHVVLIQSTKTKQIEGGNDKTPIRTLPLALPFHTSQNIR